MVRLFSSLVSILHSPMGLRTLLGMQKTIDSLLIAVSNLFYLVVFLYCLPLIWFRAGILTFHLIKDFFRSRTDRKPEKESKA